MSRLPPTFSRRFPRLLAFAWLLAASSFSLRADIDTGIDLTIWKMLYGVTDAQASDPAWLAADADGDGLSNGAELAAGTNPFSANSTLAVSTLGGDATTVSLTFPTVAGKWYVLQTTGDLVAWNAVLPAATLIGDGTPHTLSTGRGNANAFFRVLAQDVDTDGDGISDWAERISGFDPATANTHGAPQDDHSALLSALAGENTISITADKASATQPPDAATQATDTGSLTITRGGTLHFSSITVPLNWGGTAQSGLDYSAMPGSVTFPAKVGTVTLTLIPKANPVRQTTATATVVAQAGGGYRLGNAHSASVVISPAGNATGTGLTGAYYQCTSALINAGYNATNLFNPANLKTTRLDPTVDFTWSGVPTGTGVNSTYFTVRWIGQVQPEYSETYYFDTKTDDGVKLWVNGQLIIDGWSNSSADRIAAIPLQAGVLYDVKMEYYQATGTEQAHLSWFSDSQTKQVIPSSRLYPSTSTPCPPAITSATTALGFTGQPFAFTVTASTSGGTAATLALDADSGPLPDGLSLDARTGVIAGTPTTAGRYQVALRATNPYGTGASALQIEILNPGSGVTREVWTGLAGTLISDLPLTTTPATIDTKLVALEDTDAYADRTGERLRGYFVAPVTGNYFFWLAASNVAELWIANDNEPVNLVRRAQVTAPGIASRTWSTQSTQRSPWLALEAGKSYYYEVLHNTGSTGASSNLAVAWSLDATGAAAAPVGSATPGNNPVVPGYLLNRYLYPAAVAADGTLYVTNLSPQPPASSDGTGSANLRVNADYTQAVLHFNFGGLSAPRTAYHIHAATDGTGSGPIVFDLDDVDKFHPELKTADGGYIWNIVAAGALSAADIVSAVKQGYTYFNVHSVNYPAGEIRGNLRLVEGSQTAPVLLPDPGFADDSSTDAGAARFLNQAAFGASPTDLAAVQAHGYAAWLDAQFALPASHLYADVIAHTSLDPTNKYPTKLMQNAWWRAAVTAPDQLRQRVAFALSEIMVASSSNATLSNHAEGLSSYYDTLSDQAFGNFRDLLHSVTLHPTMGYFLNMQGNAKGNLSSGLHPNENYAREIMQLFSIGLNRLWPDGTVVLDSGGNLVPTYDQTAISGMARVFTGWTWNQALQANGRLPTSFSPSSNYVSPMVLVPTQHELGAKQVLDRVVLPPAVGYNYPAAVTPSSEADPTVPAFDAYCSNDLEKAIDAISNHSNTGPYLCRQLIQRLVASNPSPAYVNRVVHKFNDDGSADHVRGNLPAVIKAILLDGEARSLSAASAATGGKQREPLLRIAGPARTFPFTANAGTYSQSGGLAMTLTTNAPHRLAANDQVSLDFTGNATGSPAVPPWSNPTSVGSYTVISAPSATTFTVNASSLSSVAYTQAAGSNTVIVTTTAPGVGEELYLTFLTGGVPSGIYAVTSVPDASHIAITTAEAPAPAKSRTGTVLLSKISGGYVTKAGTPSTITVSAYVNHNLQAGDHLWMHLTAGTSTQVASQEWVVAAVADENHFTVINTGTQKAESHSGVTIYPLVPPPLTRSGSFSMAQSKFDMGSTESTLAESPLSSPTVFNFYYPDYQYPGSLAAANATTPEFQLTTDTNIVTLTNTVDSMMLSSANTSGLSSFQSGAILLDLGPYQTAGYTTDGLVTKLGDLLVGRPLQAHAAIVTYLSNTTYFPTTSATYLRDRARAAVQMIMASSEYSIQQ